MVDPNRSELAFRDKILNLLSDDEVASVCTAETAVSLATGEEFLDLEQIALGVQKARGAAPFMGRVLPRKAVHHRTWQKIQKEIAAFNHPAAPAPKNLAV